MPKSKQSLNDLLHEVRRIEQHREKLSEKQIQKIYKQLLKETNSFIADYYNKYSNGDGQLTVAMLQEKNKYAKFLEEIEKNINTLTPEASKEILSTVEKTYTACYQGMVDAVEKSKNTADLAQSMQGIQVRPETLKRAVLNPVSGLTLPDVLEKNRKAVIYDVKQVLNIGLMNGDRYDTMAKKLTEKYDMSYRKAVTISRTETHRVQEGGFFDCAADISSGLEGSELIYAATWRTMKDERVRPQRAKYKRKSGVTARKKFTAGLRSYIGSGYANHMKMEGKTVKVGEFFDLGNGVKAVAPSQSGDAGNDCNCRCYLEYDLMTVDEYAKATGQSAEKVRSKYFKNTIKAENVSLSTETQDYLKENYTKGDYAGVCDYSQYLVDGKLRGRAVDNIDDYVFDYEKDIAKNITGAINSNFTEKTLYRIDRWSAYDELKVGDELNWGIRSMSADENFFDNVFSGNDSGLSSLMFERRLDEYIIEGKKNALDIAKFSDFDQSENLVCGKYRINKINAETINGKIRRKIYIEQTE